MPKRSVRAADPIPEHWDDLKDLDRKTLADIWQRAFGRPIPARLYKPMAVPLLAYRLQELRFGGLAPKGGAVLGFSASPFRKRQSAPGAATASKTGHAVSANMAGTHPYGDRH